MIKTKSNALVKYYCKSWSIMINHDKSWQSALDHDRRVFAGDWVRVSGQIPPEIRRIYERVFQENIEEKIVSSRGVTNYSIVETAPTGAS